MCASGIVQGTLTEEQNGSGDTVDDRDTPNIVEDILYQSVDSSQLSLTVVIYAN
jgi:hypothetical protein